MTTPTTLPLDNAAIAERLDHIAELLELRGDNPFRSRAYRMAAGVIRGLRRPAHEILANEGRAGLEALPAIGKVLARAIDHLSHSGRLALLDRLESEVNPEAVFATVSGVGPELANRIRQELGVTTLEELETAAHDGRLAQIRGMGTKRLQAIRDALAGRLHRRPASFGSGQPAVDELLSVDEEYREKASGGHLRQIAPLRFNPEGEAWLPVLRTRRGPRNYRALYSNTAQAHRLGTTRDWVVIYWRQDGSEGQATVATDRSGTLRGKRVVRGREAESAEFYQRRDAAQSA